MNEQDKASVKAALGRETLTNDEQEAIVARAMQRAEEPAPPPVPVWQFAAIAAVIIASVAGVFFLGGSGPRFAEGVVERIARERNANEAYLASDTVQALLAQANDGDWVAIVGGDTFVTAGRLETVLKATHRGRVFHRFVFRKGEEGDREYQLTFGDAPWAGTRFMAQADLGFGGGILILARPGKKKEFPSPDGRPWLPLKISYPGGGEAVRDIPVVLSTGSACPLLLPDDVVYPMAEIPGRARLQGIGNAIVTGRRYTVRAVNRDLGLDDAFEAVGVPRIGDKRAADLDWKFFSHADEAVTTALGAKRSVVVVSGKWPAVARSGSMEAKLEGCTGILRNCVRGYAPLGPPEGWTMLQVASARDYEKIDSTTVAHLSSLRIEAKTTAEEVKRFLEGVLGQ